jgi:hypothetical protein
VKNTKPNTVHTARTIMFLELSRVMNFSIEKDNYSESMANNVFGKKSQDGIKKTSAFLTQIYKFDIGSDAFKAFKYFWINSEESEKAVLSFLFALNNDYLLKESIPTVSKCMIGSKLEIEQIEENILKYHPNRFTKNTLRSVSQNIASSWKQAGFLVGKVKNIRTEPVISYRVVAFAMLLAYLESLRGDFIFQNDCVLSLCIPENKIRDFALEASKRDLMTYQYAGSVTSVGFDELLTKIGINAI